MTLTTKQIVGFIVVLGMGLVGMALAKAASADIAGYFPIGVAVVAAVFLLLFGGGAAPASLGPVADAARRAAQGDRVPAPAGATPEVQRIYDELASLADARKRELADASTKQMDVDQYERALEEAVRRLTEGVQTQLGAADETSRLIRELAGAIRRDRPAPRGAHLRAPRSRRARSSR